MSLSEKQRLFTKNIARLITFVYFNLPGYELTFGEAYRTKEQQEIYFKQGKSKTMNSKHLDRLAVDFNLFINGVYQTSTEAYKPLGEYWMSLDKNNVWGGSWKSFPDGNHYEYGE